MNKVNTSVNFLTIINNLTYDGDVGLYDGDVGL